MKHLIVTLILFAFGGTMLAETLSWGSLSNTGIEITIGKETKNQYKMQVRMKSYKSVKIEKDPVVLFKLEDGNVLMLNGSLESQSEETETSHIVSGKALIPYHSNVTHSEATFPLTEEQFKALLPGITKFRIKAFPSNYDKKWGEVKYGWKFRAMYRSANSSGSDSIQDGF